MRRHRHLAALLFFVFIFRPPFSASSAETNQFYDQLRQRHLVGLVESSIPDAIAEPARRERIHARLQGIRRAVSPSHEDAQPSPAPVETP